MFAWEESKKRTTNNKEQRETMYKKELEDRASLLCRLGYTAKKTKARLKANVQWDFELHASPKFSQEVDRIVDAVYKRRGTAANLTL